MLYRLKQLECITVRDSDGVTDKGANALEDALKDGNK